MNFINVFTWMGASQKRSKNPKELVGPGGLYTISTKKKIHCGEMTT